MALVSGCGPVEFVPSPFTPQNVELIYSAQEDITIVRWRISSDDPASDQLHFELLGPTGYQRIDFSQSAYPGGSVPCGDGTGTCFQLVQRGSPTVPAGATHPVRGVHDTYGVLPGGLPLTRTITNTLTVTSFFHNGNDLVYVDIKDAVAADNDYTYLFPRTYVTTMWPTKGLCLSDSAPDGVDFSPLDPSGGFAPTPPLSDDGIYCVGLRPVPSDDGDAALAQTRMETLPQVTDLSITYAPPIEASPVIYQIVFDLSVPIPDVCTNALQSIENTIDQAIKKSGAPYTKLDTLNLALDPNGTDGSAGCTQQTGRSLPDPDAMAATVKRTAAGYSQIYPQYQFFYFNNLNAPLDPTLGGSLQQLFNDLEQAPPPGKTLTTVSWIFSPGLERTSGPTWSMPEDGWESTDDPLLKQALTPYTQDSLPFQSQILDRVVPVAFLTGPQATANAGGWLKVCVATAGYQVVDMTSALPLAGGPIWPIDGSDPPAFFPFLYPSTNTPADQFTPVSITMDLEVCTKYCDHPYVSTSGTGVLDWTTDTQCANTTE
ncbi:MAG TPA: hypothetical protein VMT03_27395 [Polyangia bacterium]|nr:hypothetical protein [Polyangia bacterium]